MYIRLGILTLVLTSPTLTLSMDNTREYYPVPVIDITTVNPYQLEELDDILNNPILESAKNNAISSASSALTSSIITNSAMLITAMVKNEAVFDTICTASGNIALATIQGAQKGCELGIQNGIINEIISPIQNKDHKNFVKLVLKDGADGIRAGATATQEQNDNILKGAAIGVVCGALSGATKAATQTTIVRTTDQKLIQAIANNTSETAINYARDAAIKTSIECTKDSFCVIS